MRHYTVGKNEYPSATTVIHILGSDRLMTWANIMGFKHRKISDILDETSAYGTLAHSIARKIVDPTAPDPPDVDGPGMTLLRIINLEKRVRSFVKDHDIVALMTEFEMISESYGFGGTCDLFGSITIDNVRYNDMIMDWKTAKSVHSTMWLQLGAYNLLLKEKGYNPKGACIIRISDQGVHCDKIDNETLDLYSEAFLKLLDFYKFWGNTDD